MTKLPTFDYGKWIEAQSEEIKKSVSRLAMGGIYDAAVYAVPSSGSTAGKLFVSTEPQTFEVVRFAGHGTRVSGVPTSHLTSALWQACRSLPICPTA